MAWRQRGPQAQLVGIATQVAVSPFALDADVPASLSGRYATRDRTQTDRNLFKSRLVRNGEQSLARVFTQSLSPQREKTQPETAGCSRQAFKRKRVIWEKISLH